jgi:hypothetical protein
MHAGVLRNFVLSSLKPATFLSEDTGSIGRALVRGHLKSAQEAKENSGVTNHLLTRDGMTTKTLSDYPLLIGEVLRRSEIKRLRRERWKALLRSVYLPGEKGALRSCMRPGQATLRLFATLSRPSDRSGI